MKQQEEDELRAQQTVLLMYKTGHALAAFMWLSLAWNGHETVALFAGAAQGIAHLYYWPPLRAELERRQRVVSFKLQVENLYVFSLAPDGLDNTVALAFRETTDFLKAVGNAHEVRVHMAIFRDVAVFTAWHDAQGRKQTERNWRDKGSASETWEEYRAWCDQFVRDDRDKRLRQLRSDQKGNAWVDIHLFDQDYEKPN